MTTKRDWHWTDESINAEPRARRRTIRNWSNYRSSTGAWAATDLKFRRADEGETFLGRQLEWIADKQPLQLFVGDTASAGGRPWWGARKSDSDDAGIVMFLESGDASLGYTVNATDKSLTWEDVLPDTDLVLYAGAAKIEKWLALMTSTAGEGGFGDRATLGFVLPDGWTLSVLGGTEPGARIEIRRPNGAVFYTSRPARAVDSSTEPQEVPCTFIDRGSSTLGGVAYRRVQVRCAPTGFTRPILMDPTVTISGGTDIEDDSTSGVAMAVNWNYGISSFVFQGTNGTPYAGLYRIATSALPVGEATAFEHHFYVAGYTAEKGNLRYVALKAANDWSEGTKNGALAAAGDPCHNYCKYNTQQWAGAIGGPVVEGADYHTEGSYVESVVASVTAGDNVFSLTPGWVKKWKDGIWTNNGLGMIRHPSNVSDAGSRGYTHRSIEWGTAAQNPYFVITYTDPPSGLMLEAGDPFGIAPRRRPVRRPARNPRF